MRTDVREFVSGPILAVAVIENVWEPLKLGLISGYRREGTVKKLKIKGEIISRRWYEAKMAIQNLCGDLNLEIILLLVVSLFKVTPT